MSTFCCRGSETRSSASTGVEAVPGRFRGLPVSVSQLNPHYLRPGGDFGWLDDNAEWVHQTVRYSRKDQPVTGALFFRYDLGQDQGSSALAYKPVLLDALREEAEAEPSATRKAFYLGPPGLTPPRHLEEAHRGTGLRGFLTSGCLRSPHFNRSGGFSIPSPGLLFVTSAGRRRRSLWAGRPRWSPLCSPVAAPPDAGIREEELGSPPSHLDLSRVIPAPRALSR